MNVPIGLESWPGMPALFTVLYLDKKGAFRYREKGGGTSCLGHGRQCPPHRCGASTFPRLLPSGSGFIPLALNLKVFSKVDLFRISWIGGQEGAGTGEGTGLHKQKVGLGVGGGDARGWEGSRPCQCSPWPGFGSPEAAFGLEKALPTALFLLGWKNVIALSLTRSALCSPNSPLVAPSIWWLTSPCSWLVHVQQARLLYLRLSTPFPGPRTPPAAQLSPGPQSAPNLRQEEFRQP